MIKFFRHIRQRLLSESKFSKYLLYAIGEIVLVVIGILIAVQINTSVNENKLHRDNEVFLNKMISELELNKKRMHRLSYGLSGTGPSRWIGLEEAVSNCDTLLTMTYRGLKETDLSFIMNVRLYAGGSFLNIHNSVYEELINTGKLYSLGSDELITAIKEYYKRCEREDLYNRGNSEDVEEGLRLIESNFSKLKMDFKMDSAGFMLSNYPWFNQMRSNNYQNLQIGISKMRRGQNTNLDKMNEIRAYSDSLIIVIEQEL